MHWIAHGIYVTTVVVLLFGITIFAHELGHFLTARRLGLFVEEFAIGFGPALWKRKIDNVLYSIRILPLGGFVKLPQLDPTGMSLVQGESEAAKEADRGSAEARKEAAAPPVSLPPIAPWKKILVSLAGSAGNIVLAVIMAFIVYVVGKPASPEECTATIGFVHEESPAYQYGLRIGHEILSINGQPVENWVDCLVVMARYTNVSMRVKTPEGIRTLVMPTQETDFGWTLRGVEGRSLSMVMAVEPGMSADRAGLKGGDIIVAFDGVELISRAQLIDRVAQCKGRPTSIRVKRDGEMLERTVTPEYDENTKQVRIGIQFNIVDYQFDQIVHPTPADQIEKFAMAIFPVLKALPNPKQAKAVSKQLGGPFAILINYWFVVKASLILAVFFTGLINVNLAIVNLLPIPVLDGGHVVFAVLEWIWRRPLNARVVGYVTNFFAFLLIGLIVLLSIRDVRRFTPIDRVVKQWMDKAPAHGIDTNAPVVSEATRDTNRPAGTDHPAPVPAR